MIRQEAESQLYYIFQPITVDNQGPINLPVSALIFNNLGKKISTVVDDDIWSLCLVSRNDEGLYENEFF